MKAVMMMAHQPTKLGKDIYGQADKYIEQLKEKYHLTGRQINDIVSRYLDNGDNWSTPASNDDKRQIIKELQRMYKDANQSDRQLISVSMANRSLHTVADVARALVAIELIHLASWRKKQITVATQSIPQKVWNYGYKLAQQSTHKSLSNKLQREPTHLEYQTALIKELNKGRRRYTRSLTQKAIAQIAKDNSSGVDTAVTINRDTVQMMNTLRDTVDTAIQRHANVRDFTRDFSKKFYGTDELSGGDLYRAERLLRTEYTYTLTNARRLDMLQRGVMYYTNMAVGTRNTCGHCLNVDGTSFLVKDMEPGTNAPPFHPNCQCEIVETPASDFNDIETIDAESLSKVVYEDEDGYHVVQYKDIKSLPGGPKQGAKPNELMKLTQHGKTVQWRYTDGYGYPKKDIDFTDHHRPDKHPVVPHVHDWVYNKDAQRPTRQHWRAPRQNEVRK